MRLQSAGIRECTVTGQLRVKSPTVCGAVFSIRRTFSSVFVNNGPDGVTVAGNGVRVFLGLGETFIIAGLEIGGGVVVAAGLLQALRNRLENIRMVAPFSDL